MNTKHSIIYDAVLILRQDTLWHLRNNVDTANETS